MSKKQMGFTLIEIVMVLVLLGILSAVAVPKYYDLRDTAEQKAARAIIAEAQARINGVFADALLNNNLSCNNAQKAVATELTSNMVGKDKLATGYTLTVTAAPGTATDTKLVKNSNDGEASYEFTTSATDEKKQIQGLAFPACSTGNGYKTGTGS